MRISDWSSDVCSSDLETARRLDMLPIPVALLALGADGLAIEASNRAFHDAGFALDRRPSALIRALGTEIADFLASGDYQYEMTWQAGDPIECRHYRVTLARAYHSGGTRCLVTLVAPTAAQRPEQPLRRQMLTASTSSEESREGK